jgi:hypothetical protein
MEIYQEKSTGAVVPYSEVVHSYNEIMGNSDVFAGYTLDQFIWECYKVYSENNI